MKEAKESRGSKKRLGRLIGDLLDDYGPSIAPPLGSALIAVSGIFLSFPKPHKWCWWIFGLGIVLNVIGTVPAVRRLSRISQLEKEIEAARDPKRVFLINSAHTEEWQVFFQHNLLYQLINRGFRPTVFTPEKDYSPAGQDQHFQEILGRKKDYSGGVVIPIIPERHREELTEFAKAFGKPIVFVDNAPFENDGDYPPRTAFVGVSSYEGGKLAAEAVIASFSPNPIHKVLVIASNTQVARQNSFEQHLKEKFPETEIVIDPGGRFNKKKAHTITLSRLKSAIMEKFPFDAIFCTSDSMTLGCLEAIGDMGSLEGFQEPRVFGYDGIAATRRLAEDPKSPLQCVVVQNHHEIAVAAMNQLDRLVKGEELMHVSIFVPPHLYPTHAIT